MTPLRDLTRPVTIQTAAGPIVGDLSLLPDATSLIVFAHGSGSSRRSSRNREVANFFHHAHLNTLLLDLLTSAEAIEDEATAQWRFDIPLLTGRVINAIDWARSHRPTSHLPIGLFGASTGAAAALAAAAARPAVRAVVSRGGRPDLADAALESVLAPTLLIVGSLDHEVVALNRKALDRLGGERRLELVPGATHLFEERGAMQVVAQLAADWFGLYLGRQEQIAKRDRHAGTRNA